MFLKNILIHVLLLFSKSKFSCEAKNAAEVSPSPELKKFIDNFKAVSMHFIEPFLKDAKVKDLNMEGFVANELTPIIAEFMKKSAIERSDDKMKTFANSLGNSFDISHEAYKLRANADNVFNKFGYFSTLESRIFPSKLGEYTAIPAGWLGPSGHGILLIIEKVTGPVLSFEHFDLTVINTGLGLDYHDAIDDSENEIAPLMYRVWKKFDKIPKYEFSKGDYWFIQALGLLHDPVEMSRAVREDYKPEKHFYETILGNFKQFEAQDKTNDGRFLVGQHSGSCAYTSLTAGLLYISDNKNEYLTRKFMYGLTLLNDFLDKCENLDITKKILGDAYESMARYLMKHLASGVAFQTLEFLESSGVELGFARLISSKTTPSLNDLKAFKYKSHIKTAIDYAVRIHKLLSDINIDKTSAAIVHEDISKLEPQRIPKTVFFKPALFPLSKQDIEKLKIDESKWPGKKHFYISSESDYTKFFPEKFTNVGELAKTLEAIAEKSAKIIHVDTIMGTYVYDFFKKARHDIDFLLKTASLTTGLTIMKSASKIMRNFMEKAILPMAIEDLAATSQLVLLTWKAALQYDSNCFVTAYLGLNQFSAPITPNLEVSILKHPDPHDPEGDFDKYVNTKLKIETCAAAPAWLTTEDDYEAWIMFEQAKSELNSEKGKDSIFNPEELFLGVERYTCIADNLTGYSALNVLKKIGQHINIRRSIFLASSLFRRQDLVGPYLVMRGVYGASEYPQYHYLIDVAAYFYFGPWWRPIGVPADIGYTFAQYDVYNMKFGPFIYTSDITKLRDEPKNIPFLRKVAVDELVEYRKLALRTSLNADFSLNQFADIRAAAAMHDSQTRIRFYAFLSLIEGAKSCVFFENSPLVFMADRLLGYKGYFVEDPNLIKRTYEVLKTMITSEMTYFKTKYELFDLRKKEKHLNRLITASLVFVRFMVRLESWNINESALKSKDLIESIAKLYDEWAPIGTLKSIYEISDDMSGRVNLFLWDCVNSGKNFKGFATFSKTFVSNLSDYKTDVDAEDIVKAHVSYRYFIASAFSNQVAPSKTFNLITKIHSKLRFPCKLPNKNSAEKALKLIAKEMVNYYEPTETDMDKNFNYTIDDDFEFIEIMKKDSKSKIPFIILRISTGRILFNGISVIHKSRIYNHSIFKQFFSQEDHLYARNGDIKPVGDKIGYSLTGFRGTGQNFLFVTNGEDNVMDIYYRHENDRWLWSNPENKATEAFLRPLRLMNLEGIRVYQKYYEEKNLLEAIFMKGSEPEPLYRLKIEKVDKPDKSEIKIHLPFIEKPVLLLNSAESEGKLNKALKGFSDPEFISVYRTEDNRAVIMYGPYRFAKEEIPLIFEEQIDESDPKSKKKIFVLLNHDNWCIDEDQTLDNDKIFLGTIKIRSITEPESKAILIPNFKLKDKDEIIEEEMKKKEEEKKNAKEDKDEDHLVLNLKLITVEMIKTSKGDLLPKDRYERLVLAYKFMLNLETDMARKLLHPIQSIDQNSPFNDEELKMLSWILELSSSNPEINALKMMTAAHFFINTLNYASVRKNYLPINIQNIAVMYLSSLRELSNKFYLHRTFPEVIENDHLFSRLFHFDFSSLVEINPLLPAGTDPESDSAYSRKVEEIFRAASKTRKKDVKPKGLDLYNYNWSKISYILKLDDNNFWYLFDLIKADASNASNYYHIHYRRNDVPLAAKSGLTSFDFELLLYCAKENYLTLQDLNSITVEGENLYKNISQQKKENMTKQFLWCFQTKHNEMIKSIPQPVDNSKMVTDINKTKEVFRKDIKEKIMIDTFTLPAETYITQEALTLVSDLIKAITKFSTDKTKSIRVGATKKDFFVETKDSYVLKNLRDSIVAFNNPDSIDGSIEVDLKSTEMKDIYGNLILLQDLLKKYILSGEKEIKDLAAELAEKTSTEKMSDGTELITKLSLSNHFKKPKTFASLYGCYYTMSPECFIRKFPHINFADAKELRDKTHIFYSKNVRQDYYNFMLEKSNNLIEANSKVSLDDLTAFVVEAKKLETFDERIKNPGILNFEFRSKRFRLRKEQTKDLDILRSKNSKGMFKSVVIQRMMAAGKTLVSGTLATVLKARELGILSILVPPSSLFQSNSASMQSRTYNYFKSRGTVLNFERIPIPSTEKAANFVLLFLKWFNDNLKLTLKSRNYLVMSPDSLQSFLNSYIEFLNYYTSLNGKVPLKDDTIQSILKAYAETYNIFLTKSSIILDEIDMTMNPKKELNYPTTTRENYNLIAVTLTTDLFEYSIFSKDILKQNLNILRNNQAGLTLTAYENIKKLWLDYIESSLDDEKSLWNVKLLYPNHSELTKVKIMKFLRCSDVSKFAFWVDSIKTSSDNLVQLNAIIIIKRQIDDFLKDSFRSTVKEHFGPAGPSRPNIKFAVPYVAANTPSETSLFADRWETLNKSLLMTAFIGLNESDYASFIFWLKEQVNMESVAAGSAKITATYENFSALLPDLNPLSIDIEDPAQQKIILSELDKKNRAAIRLLFSFYLDTVVSKLEFPTEQITSNALHMSSMFASVQGYSGTIDNINILPSEVVPEAHLDHNVNEQNNGGIVQKLILDSSDKEVTIINGMDSVKSCRNNVKRLLKAIPEADQVNLSALIDVGAFFKNFRNAKVAESLLRINSPRIRCVLYYDESSNMLQYVVEKIKLKEEASSSSGLIDAKSDTKKWEFSHGKLTLSDPDSITKTTGFGLLERFTFYDQRHITGSDILQPATAISLLTFGSRNLLRDILQGALRMRQFMTSQKVFFAITPDVVAYYNSLLSTKYKALKPSNVIALSAFNEDEKQGRENGALSFVKIDVRIRSGILKEITENILHDKFTKIIDPFKNSRSLFIRSFSENPLLWIKEKKITGAKDALEKFIKSREAMKIDAEHIKALEPLIQDCDGLVSVTDSLLCFAPKMLPEFENDILMNSEMQLELNSLQLNEFELESVNEDSKFKDFPIQYKRFRLEQCDFSDPKMHGNVVSYLDIINHKNLNPKIKYAIEASLIPKDLDKLWFSRDLVNIVHSSPNVCPYNLFGSFNLEGTHIFISNPSINDPAKVMLVSNDVAEQIFQDNLNGKAPSCKLWILTDLMGNIVATNDALLPKDGNILDSRAKLNERFFNLLIINGSLLQLSTQPALKELFFKSWVKNQGVNGGLAFLLSRMKVLQNKLRFLFDLEDPLVTTINKVINGDSSAADSLANETYDSNIENLKKLENSKSSEAAKSAALHRAQGIYDKISIKNDLKNNDLIFVIDNGADETIDSGDVSSSDNESELGSNDDKSFNMLDEEDLSKYAEETKNDGNGGGGNGGGDIIDTNDSTPNDAKPNNYSPGAINPKSEQNYLSGEGSNFSSNIDSTSLGNSSSGAAIVIIVLILAAASGAGVYYYFFASDTENKVGVEGFAKKDDDYKDGDDDNNANNNMKKPTYDSTDINPTTTSTTYNAANNYHNDNAYNSASTTNYKNNSNYYDSYGSMANNNNYYFGDTGGYYNNAGYNTSGYNNAGYNAAGYNSAGYNSAGYNSGGHYNTDYNYGYYNTGYNNFNNTGYSNSYTTGYNNFADYIQAAPPSAPADYGKNDEDKTDDFKLTAKNDENDSKN